MFERIKLAFQVAYQTLKSSNLTIEKLDEIITYTGKRYTYEDLYYDCPALSQCLIKKSQAMSNAKIVAVDDNENIVENQRFNKAIKIIDSPNDYQNRTQFIQSIETFMNLYGVCYVYVYRGAFDVKKMIVIPNSCITPEYAIGVNFITTERLIVAYTINIHGMSFRISGEELQNIHRIKDCTFDILDQNKPMSRVRLVEKNISNIVGSIQSRGIMIENRGADVVISPDGRGDTTATIAAMGQKERERMQTEYRKYGLLKGQFHALISQVALRVQRITRTPQELGLFDSENADNKAIAQIFGVPIPLLSLPDTSKYNNYIEAKKEFYDDTIKPESYQISEFFDNVFSDGSFSFMFDFSHLSFLQKDAKLSAETYKIMSETLRSNIEAGLIDTNRAIEILQDYE